MIKDRMQPMKDPKGEVYLIAGTAGKSLYDLKNKADFIATQYKDF